MIPAFMFATGIENSSPTIDGGTFRVDEMEKCGHYRRWKEDFELVRELGITGLRFFVIRHGVIPASRGGKAKTLLQNVAIGLYILPLTGWAASARFWLMLVAVVITVVTGADYVARALRLRRTSERAAMKRARRQA